MNRYSTRQHKSDEPKWTLPLVVATAVASFIAINVAAFAMLVRGLMMCLPIALVLAIGTATWAETEQEFCQAYVNMIQNYHAQIQAKQSEATQLLLQARSTQDPTLRASRLAAAKVLESEANQIVSSQIADVMIKDNEAQTKFGKRLKNMTLNGIPLPGCLDVFIWVVLARESIHFEGLPVALSNLAYDVIPDVAQVGGLVVGGGAFAGAMAILELQQIEQETEAWKAEVRNAFKLQGGSWRVNDLDQNRATRNTASDVAGMQATLNRFIDDQRTYQNKAQDVAEMEYIIMLTQQAQGARRNGDLDQDGDVDNDDTGTLQQNYGVPAGATWSMGDMDGDGDVDFGDFLIQSNEAG